jgi:hypothetical protein
MHSMKFKWNYLDATLPLCPLLYIVLQQLMSVLKPIAIWNFMAYRFQHFYNGNISENHTSGVFLRFNLKTGLALGSLLAIRLYVPVVLTFKNSTVTLYYITLQTHRRLRVLYSYRNKWRLFPIHQYIMEFYNWNGRSTARYELNP